MIYKGNDHFVTMEELEQVLTSVYGDTEYSRRAGGYVNGEIFSMEEVLRRVAEYAEGFEPLSEVAPW